MNITRIAMIKEQIKTLAKSIRDEGDPETAGRICEIVNEPPGPYTGDLVLKYKKAVKEDEISLEDLQKHLKVTCDYSAPPSGYSDTDFGKLQREKEALDYLKKLEEKVAKIRMTAHELKPIDIPAAKTVPNKTCDGFVNYNISKPVKTGAAIGATEPIIGVANNPVPEDAVEILNKIKERELSVLEEINSAKDRRAVLNAWQGLSFDDIYKEIIELNCSSESVSKEMLQTQIKKSKIKINNAYNQRLRELTSEIKDDSNTKEQHNIDDDFFLRNLKKDTWLSKIDKVIVGILKTPAYYNNPPSDDKLYAFYAQNILKGVEKKNVHNYPEYIAALMHWKLFRTKSLRERLSLAYSRLKKE